MYNTIKLSFLFNDVRIRATKETSTKQYFQKVLETNIRNSKIQFRIKMDLNSLAAQHLGQLSSNTDTGIQIPDLFNCQGPGTDSKSSNIPDIFGSADSDKPGTTLEIPDIFQSESACQEPSLPDFSNVDLTSRAPGPSLEQLSLSSPNKRTNGDGAIDLMRALTLSQSVQIQKAKTDMNSSGKQVMIPDMVSSFRVLVKLPAEKTIGRKSQPSFGGRVITRRWIKRPRLVMSDMTAQGYRRFVASEKVQPFDFSTPSPDDIVLKAQAQVFRR